MTILATCGAVAIHLNFDAHWINEMVSTLLSKYAWALEFKDAEIFA